MILSIFEKLYENLFKPLPADELIHRRIEPRKLKDNSDGTYDYNGDLALASMGYTSFADVPYVFDTIHGDLVLQNNKITSFEGFPKHVEGAMNISWNPISSLEGMPKVEGLTYALGTDLSVEDQWRIKGFEKISAYKWEFDGKVYDTRRSSEYPILSSRNTQNFISATSLEKIPNQARGYQYLFGELETRGVKILGVYRLEVIPPEEDWKGSGVNSALQVVAEYKDYYVIIERAVGKGQSMNSYLVSVSKKSEGASVAIAKSRYFGSMSWMAGAIVRTLGEIDSGKENVKISTRQPNSYRRSR